MIVKAGVVLGVLCTLWSVVLVATGLWENGASALGYLLIEIGVLIWGLRGTAAQGRRYGGQVLAGLGMAAVGAVIVFLASFLMTLVIFPNHLDKVRAVQAEQIGEMPPEQAEVSMKMLEFMTTPFMTALMGAIFTVVIGLVATLIIAAVVRSKREQALA